MRYFGNFGKLIVAFMLCGILAACGLSSDVKDRAKKVGEGITSLEATLAKRQTTYSNLKTDAEVWSFFAPYAESENWESQFAKAAGSIRNLQNRFDSEVQLVLKENKSESEADLKKLLDGIEGNFDSIRTEIRAVDDRMTLLRTGYENADAWIAESRNLVDQVDTLVENLKPVIVKTKSDFVSRSADIDTRYAPLSKMQSDATDALARAESEFLKHQSSGNTDYAVFADAVESIRSIQKSAEVFDLSYREDLEGLYSDSTTILRDMKVEYAVQLGRSTWDGNSDWDTSPDVSYDPVAISQTDYEYLAGLGVGEGRGEQGYLARVYASWGSGWKAEPYIDEAVWSRITNSSMVKGPSGDNDGMFWIEDLSPVYFHRYAEVVGDTIVEGEWEEVDEVDYALHVDDFGLAIESKALGKFADEAVAEATPPGMEMVGNEKYGEWRNDPSGNSFWHYYGQYAFFNALLGGNNHYYYRSDYDNYRNWRNERRSGAGTYGWYGSNRSSPTYGSSGSVTTQSASYKSSPFAKSGGAKSVSPSLRNAGAAARSRGPGGRGK